MMISRRGLIGGLAGLLAAPAIVRVASLMPVKAFASDVVERAFWQAPLILPPDAIRFRSEFIIAFEEQYALLRKATVDIYRTTGIDNLDWIAADR